jgi:hypothetical protein
LFAQTYSVLCVIYIGTVFLLCSTASRGAKIVTCHEQHLKGCACLISFFKTGNRFVALHYAFDTTGIHYTNSLRICACTKFIVRSLKQQQHPLSSFNRRKTKRLSLQEARGPGPPLKPHNKPLHHVYAARRISRQRVTCLSIIVFKVH